MSRLLKKRFLREFQKHVWFAQRHYIPLSAVKMVEAIKNETCPFSCACCVRDIAKACVSGECVALRDKYSYAPNAMKFRGKLSERTKKDLIKIVQESFDLEI